MIKLLSPWPALLIECEERILLASDFHLGLEYELAKMGVNIPYQTERIMSELLTVVRETRPDRVVLLGDIKHGVPITSFQERREIPRFFEALKAEVENIDVVRGNHDANIQHIIPENINLHPSSGFLIGEGYKITAMHGHAWPNPRALSTDMIIMGHNHPTVLLKTPLGVRISQRVWVKGSCKGFQLASAFLKQKGIDASQKLLEEFESMFGFRLANPQMILMPSFNDLLGGMPINTELPKNLLSPILSSGIIKIDDFEVYLLDGTFLGKVSFLRSLA